MEWLMCISFGKMTKRSIGQYQWGFVIQLIGIPWEDAVAIGQEQAVDREVTTYGKESVGLAIFGVGKP